MVSKLPEKVMEAVVLNIEDPETLRSCALTCKKWLPASRYKLFRTVNITSRASYEHLVRICDIPYITSAFENLDVLSLRGGESEDDTRWITGAVSVFAHYAKHITSVALTDFIWEPLGHNIRFGGIGDGFCILARLTLTNGKFASFDEFRMFVSAFRHLISLTVSGVVWDSATSCFTSTFESSHPHLELLWILSPSAEALNVMVEWILHTPSARTIRDLQLFCKKNGGLGAVQKLTRSLGASLEWFQLSLAEWASDDSLELLSNVSLRSLYIKDVYASLCSYLETFLRDKVRPTHLRELVFYLHICRQEELQDFQALFRTALNDVFADEGFSELQSITVWLRAVPETSLALSYVDAISSCKPALRPKCAFHVRPWFSLIPSPDLPPGPDHPVPPNCTNSGSPPDEHDQE